MSQLNTITREKLRGWAGERSFERGEGYFESGQVRDLANYRDTLAAVVNGNEQYQVKISFDSQGEFSYDCSCPYGEEGNFCKHCVAVGLAWLAEQSGGKSKKKTATTLEDVRVYLEQQPVTWLVEMVMEQVLEDRRLRGRLTLAAARTQGRKINLSAYRQTLKNAVKRGGYYDYEEDDDATEVRDSLRSVEDLLAEGYAAEVVELAEYALVELDKSLQEDEDGEGDGYGLMEEWGALHLRACAAARPDPQALAHKLFKYDIKEGREAFYGTVKAYSEILGEEGLAVYRQLAEKEWARLPALKPGQANDFRGNRQRLTGVMEYFAQESGDVAALVAIKSLDLTQPQRYLDIAKIYQAAEQHDTALAWAEKGMQTFASGTPGPVGPGVRIAGPNNWRTDSLGQFLADEYQRRGRHDEAMPIIWAQFENASDLQHYRTLQAYAERTGRPDTWAEWRGKALAEVRAGIAKQKVQARPHWQRAADNSLLVEIFLWEERCGEALAAAKAGGCTESLWLKLAALLEPTQPAEALDIYRARVVPKINETNNQAYEDAVRFLKKVHALLQQLDRAAEFTPFVNSLRTEYKRKRNFVALLDKTRW